FTGQHHAILIWLTIAGLGLAAQGQSRGPGYPVYIAGAQSGRKKPGMIRSLTHNQLIGFQVFAQYIPGRLAFVGHATHTDALALAHGVIPPVLVITRLFDMVTDNHSRARWQRPVVESAESSFADKADHSAVLAVVVF